MSCKSNNSNCGCAASESTAQKTIGATQPGNTYRPDIDIRETPAEFVVVVDVPGAAPESIDLSVDQGVLTLRAVVPPRDPTGARRVVREYGVGAYERTFRIGEGVDVEKVGAEVKDGVLTLRLPKSEVARARKIKVVG